MYKIIPKNSRSANESSRAPNLETKLYFRAIYPSATSVNPMRRIKQENSHCLFNVSNNTNESNIRKSDMKFGIDLFISIK